MTEITPAYQAGDTLTIPSWIDRAVRVIRQFCESMGIEILITPDGYSAWKVE